MVTPGFQACNHLTRLYFAYSIHSLLIIIFEYSIVYSRLWSRESRVSKPLTIIYQCLSVYSTVYITVLYHVVLTVRCDCVVRRFGSSMRVISVLCQCISKSKPRP